VTPVLETNELGKRYGRRWALSDCTLSIPPERVVGLVGPNGAGKTTLLHLGVGLLVRRPARSRYWGSGQHKTRRNWHESDL
jgi:ABC-2 type transport system ATP-binding protein